LNGGAGEVLNLVDGVATVATIIKLLTVKFPDAPNLEGDIIGMIELGLEKAWIQKTN